MPGKNQISQLTALHQKKFRHSFRLFLAEGDKIVREAVDAGYPIDRVLCSTHWFDIHQAWLMEKQIDPVVLSQAEIRKVSLLETPQQVIAVCRVPEHPTQLPAPGKLYLYMDAIRDPGNLGTIIRIADWFGVERIYASEDTVDWTNPKVIQSSMGSFLRVPVERVNPADLFIRVASGIMVFAADLEGESIYTGDFLPEGILIISSESHGLSHQLEPFLTRKLHIPRAGSGEAGPESLNAAVACAVILGEMMSRRQRLV